MNDRWEFWTTFIVASIGALAWIPNIIPFLKPNKIIGKIISRYMNLNKDKTQTFFIFKLSIISKNRPFNLGQIKCELEDLDGNKFIATAVNNRLTIFTFERPYKLLLSGDQFLNNFSIIPADKNIVGYLSFKFEGNLDCKLKSTTFIFESFDNKILTLKFDESKINKDQLFFDDSIWESITFQEIKEHPAIRCNTKENNV